MDKNYFNKIKDRGILTFNVVKKLKKIGEGGFGVVFEGFYNTLAIAIKEIRESSSEIELLKELNVLKSLKNPKIPMFYGFCNPDKVIIERIFGITLQKMNESHKEINELIKIKILLDFIDVLLFVHSNNIIHRDLKPSNIMVSSDFEARLLDFGISKLADRTKTTQNARSGTTIYFSPEFVQTRDDDSIAISKKTDIWAVGLIINELFSGEVPWVNQGMYNSYQVLVYLMEKIEFIPGRSIENEDIINLIKFCTKYDKNERYDSVNVYLHLLLSLYNTLKSNGLDVILCDNKIKAITSKLIIFILFN